MSLTDIGKQQAESTDSGGSVDADEYERYDVSGHYYLRPHPTTAVGGTAVALRRFRGDPNDDDDDDWIGLVVEDPFIHTGDDDLENTTIFASTTETGDEFKMCNLDDPQTNHMEGTGVDFDKNVFYAEPASSFDEVEWFDTSEDRLVIKLTGNAGRSAARCLDVDGLDNAGVVTDEDGTPELSATAIRTTTVASSRSIRTTTTIPTPRPGTPGTASSGRTWTARRSSSCSSTRVT